MVSNIVSNGTIYAMYMTSANYIQCYNNTLNLNDQSTTTASTYGIYSTGTTGIDIRNNISYITRSGSGTKYCIYISGTTAISNYNDLYMVAGAANYVGYNGSSYSTLANWQTANSGAWDANSQNIDPSMIGNKPTAPAFNDKGISLAAVTTDFDSVARPGTPDIGAYEFSAAGTNGTLTWSNPTGAQSRS